MKQLMMTLVALLAVTTGAWAQTDVSTFADLQTALSAGNNVKLTANIQFTSSITISDTKKILIDGNGKKMSGPSTCAFIISSGNTLAIKNATIDNFDRDAGGGAIRNNGTLVLDGCTVSNNHTDGSGQGGGAIENQGTLYASNTTFSGNYSSEIGGAINNYGGSLYLSGCTFTNNYTTASNANWGGAIGNNSTKTLVLVNCTFSGNKYGGSNGTAGDLGVFRTPGTYTIAGCTGITIDGATLTTYQYGTATLDYSDLSNIKFDYQKSDTPIAAGTPVDLTWDATAKTATLTNGMPAGNVTVSVEYFPQATAEGAVTAATGVKATTDAALVTIDKTKLTGVAKMMYYVSTDATAPDYDTEGWTDKVPTAEKFTQAADLKVWYYPVGTDDEDPAKTYSDGDMNATALAVSLGDAPTYDVTLNAEGLSTDEAAAWKVAKGDATPAAFPLEGVKKGETVTVTYSGTRKVIGVKAEKKAKANIVDLSTISGDNYTVTGDVILTGTPTESPFDIIYGGDDYEVTLDNVNSAGSKQVSVVGNYHNLNIKLKGTSRLKEIFTNTGASNGNTVTIGEAAAGGTLILTGSTDPIRGKTLTINGGTVKSQATGDNWAVYLNNTVGVLTINGGALYLAAGEDETQAVKGTVSGTLYGWNGSAWVTYTDQRYATTDNTSGNPTEWTW